MRNYSESLENFQKKRAREAELRLEINRRKPWLRNAASIQVLAQDLKDMGFYSKSTCVRDVANIIKRGLSRGRFEE